MPLLEAARLCAQFEDAQAGRVVDEDGAFGELGGDVGFLVKQQVVEGTTPRVHYSLAQARTTIGRWAQSDIVCKAQAISRGHAEVIVDFERGTIRVVDCGSRNGTFVNGLRVSEARVLDGDRISIAVAVDLEVRMPASWRRSQTLRLKI